jgi:hypothetical protein
MPLQCCLTLDDYNTENLDSRNVSALEWLIEYFPNFKVNLLVSGGLGIPKNKHPDKFAYLLHGWNHTHFEEVSEEQLDSWQYDRIYRSPYWEMTDVLYERLKKMNYKILLNTDDAREGIKFNWNIQFTPNLMKDFLLGQGHITNSINNIADKINNVLMLPRDTEFKFVREL